MAADGVFIIQTTRDYQTLESQTGSESYGSSASNSQIDDAQGPSVTDGNTAAGGGTSTYSRLTDNFTNSDGSQTSYSFEQGSTRAFSQANHHAEGTEAAVDGVSQSSAVFTGVGRGFSFSIGTDSFVQDSSSAGSIASTSGGVGTATGSVGSTYGTIYSSAQHIGSNSTLNMSGSSQVSVDRHEVTAQGTERTVIDVTGVVLFLSSYSEEAVDPDTNSSEFIVNWESGFTSSAFGGTDEPVVSVTGDSGQAVRSWDTYNLLTGTRTSSSSGFVDSLESSFGFAAGSTVTATTTVVTSISSGTRRRLTTLDTTTHVSTLTDSSYNDISRTALTKGRTYIANGRASFRKRGTPEEIYNFAYIVPEDLIAWVITSPIILDIQPVQNLAVSHIGQFQIPNGTVLSQDPVTLITDNRTATVTWAEDLILFGAATDVVVNSSIGSSRVPTTSIFVGSLSNDTKAVSTGVRTTFTENQLFDYMSRIVPGNIGGPGYSSFSTLTVAFGPGTTRGIDFGIDEGGFYSGFRDALKQRPSSTNSKINKVYNVNFKLASSSFEEAEGGYKEGDTRSDYGSTLFNSNTETTIFSSQGITTLQQTGSTRGGFTSGSDSGTNESTFSTSLEQQGSTSESASFTLIPDTNTDDDPPQDTNDSQLIGPNQRNSAHQEKTNIEYTSELAGTIIYATDLGVPIFVEADARGVDVLRPQQTSGLGSPLLAASSRDGVVFVLASSAQFPWTFCLGQQPGIYVPFPWLRYFTTVDDTSRTTVVTNTSGGTSVDTTFNTQSNSYTVRWDSQSMTIYVYGYTGGTSTHATSYTAEFSTSVGISNQSFYTTTQYGFAQATTGAGGWTPNGQPQYVGEHTAYVETILVDGHTDNDADTVVLAERSYSPPQDNALTVYSNLPGFFAERGAGSQVVLFPRH